MTNRKRLVLADRVQKNIKKKSAGYWIVCRKKQIEKEFNRDRQVRDR